MECDWWFDWWERLQSLETSEKDCKAWRLLCRSWLHIYACPVFETSLTTSVTLICVFSYWKYPNAIFIVSFPSNHYLKTWSGYARLCQVTPVYDKLRQVMPGMVCQVTHSPAVWYAKYRPWTPDDQFINANVSATTRWYLIVTLLCAWLCHSAACVSVRCREETCSEQRRPRSSSAWTSKCNTKQYWAMT